MGHCHSPAQLGGPRRFLGADGRAAGLAAERRALGLGRRSLLAAVRLYQAFLSPLMFSACKFHPSCSRYAYQAIEEHGPGRGSWLAVRRVLRCRPFSPGGYDPVPTAEELREAGR